MKSAAPALMASTAIGTSPWPVIMIAGSRRPSLLSRCSSSSPPMPGIRASTSRHPSPPGAIGIEERLGAGVDLDRPAVFPEQIAQRFAHRVCHRRPRRWSPAGDRRRFGRLPVARSWRRVQFSKTAPDQGHQLPRLHRLVQVQVAALGDLAQGVGRNVAGQDDRRDLVTERLPQAGDDLQAVQAVRQIVVGDDEVRAYRAGAPPIPAPPRPSSTAIVR